MNQETNSSPENAQRRREIFLAALDKPTEERAAYLDDACGGDASLRLDVEELIAEHESGSDLLDSPAMAREPSKESGANGTRVMTTQVVPVTERPGERIGRYKLLQQIGEGGCGVVYMAEQEEPVRRRVALKIIKLGMDTKGVIARFEAERQALAMMDHPNIARVLDAGATETGRPYFVMELVRGIKITDYCDENKLPTNERLNLFIQVCQAIQHAHQKGIIHRDIKPSNILVTLHDSVPVPKVIDFGIAKAIEQKLTDKTLFTQFQSFIGTPAYMSPEQAEMSGLDIDTRGDVYSLGVLLYELLTGRTPFDPETLISRGIDECRRTIREDEPARPSVMLGTLIDGDLSTAASRRRTEARPLVQQMRGDLDWIVMKCLEKNRTRRYETAAALAADIQRYQDNEPIMARPPSAVYRFKKLLRKHRGAVAAAGAVAVALLLGTVISVGLAVRATKAEEQARVTAENEILLRQEAETERQRAEREKATARLNEYVADINLARLSLQNGNLGRAVQLLRRHIPEEGEPDLRGFEWRYLAEASKGDEHQTLVTGLDSVQALAVSPNSQMVAVSDDKDVHVYVLNTGVRLATLSPDEMFPSDRDRSPSRFAVPDVDSIAFLDGGRFLATANRNSVRLWRTDDWTSVDAFDRDEASGPVTAPLDGSILATAAENQRWGSKGVVLWKAGSWEPKRKLEQLRPPMVFSRDSQWLAADSEYGIQLWPVRDHGRLVLMQNSSNLFGRVPGVVSDHPLAFSPDGTRLVAARNRVSEKGVFVLSIWDVNTGEEIGTIPSSPDQIEHTGVISSLVFSPDGALLATASMDHSIRLWDFERRELIDTLDGHLTEIWSLTMSPDGRTLVSGDKNGVVHVWKTERPEPRDPFPGLTRPLGFAHDSGTLAALDEDGAVVFVDMATGEAVRRIALDDSRGWNSRFALSADLNVMVQSDRRGAVTLVDIDAGDTNVLEEISNRSIELLSLSPNGRYLVAGGRGQMPRWWDLRAGTNVIWEIDANRVLFSPSGNIMATMGGSEPTRIWRVDDRSLISTLQTNENIPAQLGTSAFSSDDNHIAISLADHSIGLWDAESGAWIGQFEGHMQPASALAFSPDDLTLATAGFDSTVRFWNVSTRTELMIERNLGVQLSSLVFSPDGQLLVGGGAFGSREGGLQLYHAPRSTVIGSVDVH